MKTLPYNNTLRQREENLMLDRDRAVEESIFLCSVVTGENK